MSLARANPSASTEAARLDAIYADVETYYGARVAKFGATPLGVDWSCAATQWLRFVQLLKGCDFSAPSSLNDVGCGYGALADFLSLRHPEADIDYLGVDLSPAMIRRARRRRTAPNCRFAVGRLSPRVADYSIASGVMNVQLGHSRSDWELYVAETLVQMRRTSRHGFAANFICEAVESRSVPVPPGLYRTAPDPWVRFCEQELGCSVVTLANYGLREFTLLVRIAEEPTLEAA